MDTAGSELLASAFSSQGARLSLQEEQLATLSQGVKGLAHSQDEFTAAVTAQIGGLAEQIQQLLGGWKEEFQNHLLQNLRLFPLSPMLEFDWLLPSDIQEILKDVTHS